MFTSPRTSFSTHRPRCRGCCAPQGSTDALSFAARFALEFDGIAARDKGNYARFFAQAFAEAASGVALTRHDDVCFATWAIERGLRPHVTKYSQFRFLREAYFN